MLLSEKVDEQKEKNTVSLVRITLNTLWSHCLQCKEDTKILNGLFQGRCIKIQYKNKQKNY